MALSILPVCSANGSSSKEMHMKASVFIATSLDGFIARRDGSLDWLPGAEPEPGEISGAEAITMEEESGDDHGWGEFWGSVDCLVLGRKSFEKVLEFGIWAYEGTRVIVLSRNPSYPVPEEMADKVELFAGDPRALVDKLAAEGHKHLYIDGGQTIQSFLREGLITDLTITSIPVLIGEGIPLFGPLPGDLPLRHIKTRALADGMVQSMYEVAGAG
jgi:dihydrofolate reductase